MKHVKPEDIVVLRRTFEASKHPKGSDERKRLNMDALTSEYGPSMRYMVRYPAMMNDGTPSPAQKYFHDDFRLKRDAEVHAEILRKRD